MDEQRVDLDLWVHQTIQAINHIPDRVTTEVYLDEIRRRADLELWCHTTDDAELEHVKDAIDKWLRKQIETFIAENPN